MSVGHGMQDAAKTMGIVVLALYTGGFQDSPTHIPWWVVLDLGDGAGARHVRRRLADHPYARPQDHRPAARPRASPPRRWPARCSTSTPWCCRRPDLHHPHDHLGDHGRRRDQAAVRGALERGRQHRRSPGSSRSRPPRRDRRASSTSLSARSSADRVMRSRPPIACGRSSHADLVADRVQQRHDLQRRRVRHQRALRQARAQAALHLGRLELVAAALERRSRPPPARRRRGAA